jgi:hypothetical protein
MAAAANMSGAVLDRVVPDAVLSRFGPTIHAIPILIK